MKSLHIKFFLAIGALVLGLGGIAFYVQSLAFHQFSMSMTQILNEKLAQRLVGEYFPMQGAEARDIATVRAQFSHLMSVNPSIELYLVDSNGAISAYTAPKQEIRRQRVDLAPIERFVSHKFDIPLLGDDPRDADGAKIFSAAPLDAGDAKSGYLYVILGGSEYDAAARRTEAGLWTRSAFLNLGLSVIVALLASFIVLTTMTSRLRRLAHAVDDFRESGFLRTELASIPLGRSGDELDRLAQAFAALAARLRAQLQEIAKTNALRAELISGVSHDLRTPLASLRGYLETLTLKGDSLPPEERRRFLEIASRQCGGIGKLVEDLFELAKLDEPTFRFTSESLQISELVQDVLQKFELSAQGKNVTLVGEFLPEAPLVRGDVSLLERMLDNLITNALRHTPPKGVVRVAVGRGENCVTVEISDTGPGITIEHAPHVFDRLHRADDGRAVSHGGAGLGLPIARRIAELHGGRIWLRSEFGEGACFLVELPTDAAVSAGAGRQISNSSPSPASPPRA